MSFCFEEWLCKSSNSANLFHLYAKTDVSADEQSSPFYMLLLWNQGSWEQVHWVLSCSYVSSRNADKFLVQRQCCSLDALVKSKTRQTSCAGVRAGEIYEPERFTAWISDCLGLKGWQFKTRQNKQIKTCKSEHETMWNIVKSFVHDSDFREEFCICINSGQQQHNSSCFFPLA